MLSKLRHQPTDRRRTRACRPTLDALEKREVLSWGGTPPAVVNLNSLGDRFTVNSFGGNGNYSYSSTISRNEADTFRFVAQRSGTYTFEGRSYGSRIDTVEALFDTSGRRLAYNDDVSSSNSNSKFTYRLQAGQTYVLAITNYNNSPGGSYSVLITSPSLSAYVNTGVGGTYYSSGSASLVGTNLRLDLFGSNRSTIYYQDHTIEVKILDIYGRAIHSGSWVRSFRTGGSLVFEYPGVKSDSWNFDLSGWNLSRASRLWVEVSYG